MMRYAEYLSFKTPRLFESHLRNQVSGTPFRLIFHLHLSSADFGGRA